MKSDFWRQYKLSIERNGIEPTESMRVTFYRAIDIYRKMKRHTQEYMDGFMDGAGIGQEVRKYIEFIQEIEEDGYNEF